VTWNVEAVIGACLDALPAALDDEPADIVVVDNFSSDGTGSLLATRSGIIVLDNPTNEGYARAMNRALGEELGGEAPDVLIALNPDTVPRPGSLATLARYLRRHPTVGLAVPRLLNPNGTEQHSVHRFPSPAAVLASALLPPASRSGRLGRRYRLEGRSGPETDSSLDWAIGAVHVMAVKATGRRPYNERWFIYGEDLDLCWRLAASGWERRIVPSVEVTHVGNVSGGAAFGSDRSARVWETTYDWYRLRRGPVRARCLAAANVVAVGGRVLAVAARRVSRRPVPQWDSGLRSVLGVHLRALAGR
jgi:N-acetylglucosaminyl-diphospho-decaprenol L-rhamnosyltransferase